MASAVSLASWHFPPELLSRFSRSLYSLCLFEGRASGTVKVQLRVQEKVYLDAALKRFSAQPFCRECLGAARWSDSGQSSLLPGASPSAGIPDWPEDGAWPFSLSRLFLVQATGLLSPNRTEGEMI